MLVQYSESVIRLNADVVHNVTFIQQKQMSMQMEMHSEVTMGISEENGDESIQQQKCLNESGLEDL